MLLVNNNYDFNVIFKYVQYIQEKFMMNNIQYDNFLKELYKTIKNKIKHGKTMEEEFIRYKSLELCIEENKIIYQFLLDNEKYTDFVHKLFE